MVAAELFEDSSTVESREGLPVTGCFSKTCNSRHMLSICSGVLADPLPGSYTSLAL